MIELILKRVALAIPVVVIVSLIVFSLLFLSPADPAAIIAGDGATPEAIEATRVKLGLDQPMLVQYVRWVGHILGGDLGMSLYEDRPVAQMIVERAKPTISLALSIVLFSTLFAVPLGLFSAWWAGSAVDRLTMMFAAVGTATPVFLFAYILVGIFVVQLGVLPAFGFQDLGAGIGLFLYHIALPTITGGIAYGAIIARVTRAVCIEALSQDYMRTAKAKGLSVPRMVFTHALPNASIPIVTVIGTRFASLLGGVVVTETVFAIPGVGRLTIEAILHRDFPVVQGVIIVMALVYVSINLVIDILYAVLDPRIRQ